MRAHRDELIQKGILLPDLANATSPTNASNTLSTIAGKKLKRFTSILLCVSVSFMDLRISSGRFPFWGVPVCVTEDVSLSLSFLSHLLR